MTLVALVAITGAARAEATAGEGASAQAEGREVLAVVNARAGSLEKTDKGSYQLTLTGVPPKATWFSDRPVRLAGTYSMAELSDVFFKEQTPPNAALEIFGAPDGRDVFVVTISEPRYQPSDRRLVLDVQLIGDPNGVVGTALSEYAPRADATPRSSFRAAALFIDSATSCPVTFSPVQSGYLTSFQGIDCNDAVSVAQKLAQINDACTNYAPTDLGPPFGTWECQDQGSQVPFQVAPGNTYYPNASFWYEATYG